MNSDAKDQEITASVLVIGDEILSGRTKDKNVGTIADVCTSVGIDLQEVRIVSDVTEDIVDAVNALRSRYTYVFTTGGIGPTHDDITADAVAKAFGVALPVNEEARKMLEDRLGTIDLSPERLRMARIPVGAELIVNSISGAPGFKIGNVHVMAGVPKIMESMLDTLVPTLKTGKKMLSWSIDCGVGESTVSAALGKVQEQFPDAKIGSYPQMGRLPVYAQLVVRATDPDILAAASKAVAEVVAKIHAEKGVVLPKESPQ